MLTDICQCLSLVTKTKNLSPVHVPSAAKKELVLLIHLCDDSAHGGTESLFQACGVCSADLKSSTVDLGGS